MRGIVSLLDHDEASLVKKVQKSPQMVGWDLASTVTIEKAYENADQERELHRVLVAVGCRAVFLSRRRV